MGLFSSKPKKNFLDILGLQINSKLESRLVEVAKEDNFTDYSVDIKENFGLFNRAIFRIFSHKPDLSGNSPFNLILEYDVQSITIKKIKKMVNTISDEYGKDRTGKTKWSNYDSNALSTYWEGREWIINKKGKSFREFNSDCIQINLRFNFDDGIDFSILFANELINSKL